MKQVTNLYIPSTLEIYKQLEVSQEEELNMLLRRTLRNSIYTQIRTRLEAILEIQILNN
jgi:hypothetical protein